MSTRKLIALSLFAAIVLSSGALAQGGGGGGGGAGGASGGAAGGASGAGRAPGTKAARVQLAAPRPARPIQVRQVVA
jgi:hypothetical protein